jgi:selenocysteine lyase/cysteine desulfurase
MIMMSAKHLKGNYEIIMRDRADVVLKYIEKTVRAAASYGRCRAKVVLYNESDDVIDIVLNTLKDLGYETRRGWLLNCDFCYVSWKLP